MKCMCVAQVAFFHKLENYLFNEGHAREMISTIVTSAADDVGHVVMTGDTGCDPCGKVPRSV